MTEHYFSHQPGVESSPKDVSVSFAAKDYVLTTDRGVFSYEKIDKATRILLEVFLEKYYGPQPEIIADVGSGCGVISCVMANRFQNSKIVAVEPNERARALTQINYINNISDDRLKILEPEEVDDEKVDLIISNPPIRIGKEQLYSLLKFWSEHLSNEGQMWLVVARHLGSDSVAKYLESECGLKVTRVASKKGFRILRCRY